MIGSCQVVACPRVLNCAPMDSKALKQQGQLRPELLEVPIPMVKVVVGVRVGE